MTGSTSYDLSDTWHGRFTYPGGAEETAFTADLVHTGDVLSGTIDEPGQGHAVELILTASLSGEVAGDTVTFVKTYDVAVLGYERPVHYRGAIRDEGLEIAGTWTIAGVWSGSFLMIRARGLSRAAARKQAEKV